ncbi:hypothetical protein GCM10010502_74500 [Kitasatospora aureofaciens]|uniref:Uncharacterized protein n=1 Tax=Kitasatospora aureofaciens TaxID=1894 RepID=A0A8H9I2Q0_KITAU|nr:hypothetical protein GCM10010502_74500 [Kitasatospora aureofaciens]
MPVKETGDGGHAFGWCPMECRMTFPARRAMTKPCHPRRDRPETAHGVHGYGVPDDATRVGIPAVGPGVRTFVGDRPL